MYAKQILLVLALAELNICPACLATPGKPVETDPHYLSDVPGYYLNGPNGEHIWNTNTDPFWRGVWKEDPNGWRVQLNADTNRWLPQQKAFDTILCVELGSVKTNSWGGYCQTPDNKFARFELLDVHGSIVQPRPGVGTNLFGYIYVSGKPYDLDASVATWRSDVNSLEENYPETITTNAYRQFLTGDFLGGGVSFASNAPPYRLNLLNLNDLYLITNNGDYTLTVCPVVYKRRFGTNYSSGILDRVDLPCVTTKVHLFPSDK
jgi:hypothetical protein